jgi:hypothetical protein
MPAKAGIQGNSSSPALDPRFRGGDKHKYVTFKNLLEPGPRADVAAVPAKMK